MGQEIPYNLRLPVHQRRTIFREMAKGELRRGPMPPRRYRALVAYAARLGIHPTESTELIAQAARDLGLSAPGRSPEANPGPAASTPPPDASYDPYATRKPKFAFGTSSVRLWLTVLVLAVAAALLDVLRCHMR